jgi:hypothetical protein
MAPRPGVRGPGRESDQTNLSVAKIRNEWSYASTPSVFLNDIRTDNITLMFTT